MLTLCLLRARVGRPRSLATGLPATPCGRRAGLRPVVSADGYAPGHGDGEPVDSAGRAARRGVSGKVAGGRGSRDGVEQRGAEGCAELAGGAGPGACRSGVGGQDGSQRGAEGGGVMIGKRI